MDIQSRAAQLWQVEQAAKSQRECLQPLIDHARDLDLNATVSLQLAREHLERAASHLARARADMAIAEQAEASQPAPRLGLPPVHRHYSAE